MVDRIIERGTIKRLHVNQHILRSNRKHGLADPPITIQTSRGSQRCRTARIMGESSLVYRPDKPISCGAVLWIETTARIEID